MMMYYFVSPSDHLIKPIDDFQDLIRNAQDVAKDNIVTLGNLNLPNQKLVMVILNQRKII